MKKSKTIRLVLLGTTSLALAACDETPPNDAKFFSSVRECTAVHSEATCKEQFKKSEEAYVAEAPRYTKKEECEAQFGPGNCETRQASQAGGGMGSFFMPMMMGYMMGNMMGNRMGGNAFSGPVYRGPNNSAMTQASGKMFNAGTFTGTGRAAPFQKSAQFSPVSRGGFGSTASYHTSSGS